MSKPRFALDTNILVYAEGANGTEKASQIVALLARLDPDRWVIPSQVTGELFNVMTRKFNRTPDRARALVAELGGFAEMRSASLDAFADALDLAVAHHLQFWDALILATAAEAGCVALLSEDLQDGAVFRGVTVINPFAEPIHPLLADALCNPA